MLFYNYSLPIPLCHLTYTLGLIPLLNTHYEYEISHQEARVPYVVYREITQSGLTTS